MAFEATYRYCQGCQRDLGDCKCGAPEALDPFDHEPVEPVVRAIPFKPRERPRKDMPWRANESFQIWHDMRRIRG